jgi:large subunit ribosomal protein L6
MSRVAKNPIILPQGVEVELSAEKISVKGPLGAISFVANPAVTVVQDGGSLLCKPVEGAANSNALSGTVRAVVANMVVGVSKGFERKLNLVGVGYRAQAQGDVLNLTLGFSHPVAHRMPAGVKCETPTQTEILIKETKKK